MTEIEAEVRAFLEGVSPERRKRDGQVLLELMQRATGEEPKLHGTIVGFGRYHYKYASGREGDAAAAAFSPRKAATTIYVSDGVGAHAELLGRLGPHKTGVGCIYIKDLEDVDLDVLEEIVRRSYRTLSAGSYTDRAREGGTT